MKVGKVIDTHSQSVKSCFSDFVYFTEFHSVLKITACKEKHGNRENACCPA